MHDRLLSAFLQLRKRALTWSETLSVSPAGGDALAYVLEGTGEFTIDGVPNQVSAGSCIVMPVGIPHAVKAVTKFKMLLVVIK